MDWNSMFYLSVIFNYTKQDWEKAIAKARVLYSEVTDYSTDYSNLAMLKSSHDEKSIWLLKVDKIKDKVRLTSSTE